MGGDRRAVSEEEDLLEDMWRYVELEGAESRREQVCRELSFADEETAELVAYTADDIERSSR